MIDILVIIVVGLAMLFWHELAHAVAALHYDAMQGVVLFYHQNPTVRVLFWGAGIVIDDAHITGVEIRLFVYAPAVLLIPGLLLWPIEPLRLLSISFLGGGVAVVSDMATGVIRSENIERLWLWDRRPTND